MTLSDVAIRRPVFTAMLSLALVVMGVMGYLRLGTDLFPDVSMPFVTVTTVYPGAGPEDIEEEVTRPIEDAVAGIQGVERVFSQSRENVSLVFIQFELSVAQAEATQQVRDKVGIAVRDIPPTAEAPVIAQYDLSSQPILVFSAASSEDSLALRALLDDQVKPRLEQIDGVAAIRILGGDEKEIAVDLDPDRLSAAGLVPEMVIQRIRAEHLDLPAGRFDAGPQEIGVRVTGEFRDIDELRRMVVTTHRDGSHVRLEDVALVRETVKEARTQVRANGRSAIAVEVVKQGGTNTIAVAGAVKEALAELHERFGDRFRADPLIDPSLVIEANAHEVWIAIYFGGAMAILIILIFLMDLRGTFISALALPTSVVGTLFFMWAMGYTLNQLTLLGLSLAIGLLIDDAVVVRESITRRLDAGEDPVDAASNGTREIALAVLATTLTLCAVFVPVAFMQGIVGRFFRQFGLTISAAVLLSLFVAFTLDPMLSARLARRRRLGEEHRPGALERALKPSFDALDSAYARSLDWVLAHGRAVVIAALALFLGSVGVAARLGSDFIGSEDRGQIVVEMEFPSGTSLATTSDRSGVAEAEVAGLPGVTTVYAVLGPREDVRRAEWRVLLVDKNEREHGLDWYKERVREALARVPQAKVSVSDPPVLEGLGNWPPILMQVVGREFDVLSAEAAHVAGVLRSIPGTADVKVNDNPGRPELLLRVDRDVASNLGLPAGAVAAQVRLASHGDVAGRLRQGRDEVDIRVRLPEPERGSADALSRLWVQGPRGPVGLSQLVDARRVDGPAVIEHEMRERQITVSAQLAPGANLGDVVQDLKARLADHPLPPGYTYIYNGQQKDMADMIANLVLALALALVFIYMVLASQFESVVHPFTIMLSLPLALVGAVLALAATGHTLGMGANIGVILLMGLVTKNAILLVDGALQSMREGDPPAAAMRRAGPRRLRPILMTSAAMVMGMLPTALGTGMGSEFRSPMAISVIGGVVTSTLLTLWVVPVVFLWVEGARGGFSSWLRRRGLGGEAGPEEGGFGSPTDAAAAMGRSAVGRSGG
ncbi:efflux RND transporter permease subunit [Myxococcota bacterium]|nr:efflux RND transporter permease subunit [Myxococcota bacterium]